MTLADVTAGFAELLRDNPNVASEILGDIDPITWINYRTKHLYYYSQKLVDYARMFSKKFLQKLRCNCSCAFLCL